uniref:Uncharacterized protein n=1 Tax=Amphimedon queenslandica TaxID=400682 RepID=A0A1X7TGG4_AMPQE
RVLSSWVVITLELGKVCSHQPTASFIFSAGAKANKVVELRSALAQLSHRERNHSKKLMKQ